MWHTGKQRSMHSHSMFKGEVAWTIRVTAAANRPQQPQMTWSPHPLQVCTWSRQC